MQNTESNPLYALQDLPGKGKGLIAIENISKGTRIVSEEPIITVPRREPNGKRLRKRVCRQVDSLSEHQRQAFLSMHNIHTYGNAAERYVGIVRTNGLPIRNDGSEAGIFFEACRINHACDNNAQKNWNENTRRHTVHALRDIKKGEEITIYYLGAHKNRATRQQELQSKFGFTCSCRLCSLPADQNEESDKRLDAIYRLDGLIGRAGLGGIVSSPLQFLRYVDQQVHLYNEQGPGDSGLPRAFFDAAQLFIANGDLARGRIFTERAVSGWRTSYGGDSPEVIDYGALAQDPSKHELYGMSMKWKTSVGEVPHGLELDDFEDWLWKRKKPQRPGQLADLRNSDIFPRFHDLPDENDVDLNYYRSSDMVTYQPRRHWCFLAEIVDFATLLRLQMNIKDIDGISVPLFFYTDGRGNEVRAERVQRGYTVALLYAHRHAFISGEVGIRHEDPPSIKVLQTITLPYY